ncbi:MAG TPA: hypothetical protein PKZ08_00530 [Vicinamibacterales bacterium]|nr:hypothetical protein [Vicinamibacterales bacterium]
MAGDLGQCKPGCACANVVKLAGELDTERASVDGEVKLLSTQLRDLADAVRALPRAIAEQIAKERSETDERLQRGHEYFDRIFGRLDGIEKRVQEIAGLERQVEDLGDDLRAHTSGAQARSERLDERFTAIANDKHALDRRLVVMWTLVGLIGFGELWRLVALVWPVLGSLVR